MTVALAVLWFAVAICPDWWPVPLWWWRRFPWPPPPDPPAPGPYPPPWKILLTGVAGIAGGYLFLRAFGPGQGGLDATYAATTCIGALAGSIIAGGVLDTLLPGRQNPAR